MHYLRDKAHLKSHREATENLAAIAWAYTGKTFADLPAVAQLVNATREGVRPGVVLSDATVRQRLALLKAACRWGWRRHGMGEGDPTVRMQLPTVRNERHVYVTRQQMLELALACRLHATRVLVRAAFYTGMRVGELERVEVSGGALHLADSKNGERRSIPVHPRLRTCLRFLPVTAPRTTVEKDWQQARAAVGLAHVHLHDLRHSAASELVNAGVDLYTVGAVLGHKDPRSTKRYSHLTHATLADAIGKIGRKRRRIAPHNASAKRAA